MAMPWYSTLNSKIDANYSIAQKYYAQKEMQFKEVLISQGMKDLDKFTDELTKIAKSFHPNITAEVYKLLRGQAPLTAANALQDSEFKVSIQNILESVISSKSAIGRVKFVAGGEFEHFIVRNLTALLAQNGVNINNLIAQQVGNVVNNAFVTSGAKDTRTDIALHAGGKKIDNTVQMELISAELKIDKLSSKLSQQEIYDAILAEMVKDNISQDIYGFQVKTYGSLGGNRWMNSSTIFSNINSIFNNGKTWSSEYATLYPTYYLSKYLIQILNPVNIGIIYGKGIIYSSTFLEKYRFYMEVTYEDPGNDGKIQQASLRRGGGWEVYPSLASNVILMHQLQGGSLKPSNEGKLTKKAYGSKTVKVAKLQSK